MYAHVVHLDDYQTDNIDLHNCTDSELLDFLKKWDYGDNYGEACDDPESLMGTQDHCFYRDDYFVTHNPILGYAGLHVKVEE